MRKEAGKRGQFYLIAGIIIAVMIMGVAVISNYIKKESGPEISDLKEEIKIESSYVVDYALVKAGAPSFNDILTDFTYTYKDYFKGGKSHYFIFGDQDSMTVAGYQTENRSVSLNGEIITSTEGEFTSSITLGGAQDLTLEIDDNTYSFPISKGKNFYFVVSQLTGNEEHIITG